MDCGGKVAKARDIISVLKGMRKREVFLTLDELLVSKKFLKHLCSESTDIEKETREKWNSLFQPRLGEKTTTLT